uniref:Transmembrane protein n=1 Tax=Moniliophthora roreri TaxID=221103 RepID=A0A0W0F7W7_MONRR
MQASDPTKAGVPPYYMISYELGGTPRISLLGTNRSELKWTAVHAAGSKLILSLADSEGNTGGIPSFVYFVEAGNSDCLPQIPDSSDFTVSANVTSVADTCEPWGLRIKGGVKPYNLTLLQLNSAVVTNVTMGKDDDAFTFINRGNPGTLFAGMLMIPFSVAVPDHMLFTPAAGDSTGRYARGTPSMTPLGSYNVDCVGLVSSSGKASELDPPVTQPKSRRPIIIGVVVGVFVVLAIGHAWYFWYYRPRRRRGAISTTRTIDPFFDNSLWGRKTRGEPVPNENSSESEPGTVIVQHRDGGPSRVQELPPPYADAREMEGENESRSPVEQPNAVNRIIKGNPLAWSPTPFTGNCVQELPPPYADSREKDGKG